MTIVRYHHLIFLVAWATSLSKWETNAFVTRPLGSRFSLSNLERPSSYAKPIQSQQHNYNSLSNIDSSFFASSPSKHNNEILRPKKRADRYIATQVAAALVMLMSLTSCLPLSWAASEDPMVFNGNFNDPLHPMCKRRIEVSKDGKTFHFSGTTSGKQDDETRRGCGPNEIRMYGIYFREFDGTIVDGNKISFGDGAYEGVWEPAGKVTDNGRNGGNLDGIRWSNGYKWTKVVPKVTLPNTDKRTDTIVPKVTFPNTDKRTDTISRVNIAEKAKEYKGKEQIKKQEQNAMLMEKFNIKPEEKQIKKTKVNSKPNDEVKDKKEESVPTKEKGKEIIQDKVLEKIEGASEVISEKTTVEEKIIKPEIKAVESDEKQFKTETKDDVKVNDQLKEKEKEESTPVKETIESKEPSKIIDAKPEEKPIKAETKDNVKVNDQLKEEKKEESTPVKETIENKEPSKIIDVKPEEKPIKTETKDNVKINDQLKEEKKEESTPVKGTIENKEPSKIIDVKPEEPIKTKGKDEKVRETNKKDVTQVKETKEEKEPDFETIVRARIPKGDSPAEKELEAAEKLYKKNYDYLF